MKQSDIEEALLKYEGTWCEEMDDPAVFVYKTGTDRPNGHIYGIVVKDVSPVRLSLRCDLLLANNLRELYETVLPDPIMKHKEWVQIICTGQVLDADIKSLIDVSYRLANNQPIAKPVR